DTGGILGFLSLGVGAAESIDAGAFQLVFIVGGLHFAFFLSINTSLLLMIDRTAAIGRGCVKTPNNGVFVGTKMPPRVAIVDSRASCEVDSSIELSKIEFSHSLGRLQALKTEQFNC